MTASSSHKVYITANKCFNGEMCIIQYNKAQACPNYCVILVINKSHELRIIWHGTTIINLQPAKHVLTFHHYLFWWLRKIHWQMYQFHLKKNMQIASLSNAHYATRVYACQKYVYSEAPHCMGVCINLQDGNLILQKYKSIKYHDTR